MALPLEARIAVLPCRGGEPLLRRLFEPLGYEVWATRHPLDPKFPDWGESSYFTVTLKSTIRLSDLLTHLYVLIPVLDDDKHYWVGDAEVEKLLRHGEGWLRQHPEREPQFWPFDGWEVPPGNQRSSRSIRLRSHSIPRDSRDSHQQMHCGVAPPGRPGRQSRTVLEPEPDRPRTKGRRNRGLDTGDRLTGTSSRYPRHSGVAGKSSLRRYATARRPL